MTKEEKGKGDNRREVAGRDHIRLCRRCKDGGFCLECCGGHRRVSSLGRIWSCLASVGVTLVRITWGWERETRMEAEERDTAESQVVGDGGPDQLIAWRRYGVRCFEGTYDGVGLAMGWLKGVSKERGQGFWPEQLVQTYSNMR